MSAPIRIGIIGTGGMANWHARQLQASGSCTVVAACDVDLPRAQAFAKNYGAEHVFDDYHELVRARCADAVCIVTPNDQHYPAAMAALGAGLHVLCEKPLACSLADATAMTEAARNAGVIHVVNFTHRNAPCFTLGRTLLNSGHIGTIYHVQATYLQDWLLTRYRSPDPGPAPWRLDRQVAGSGQLGDLGSHLLDLLHGMVGDVATVSASLPTFPELHTDDIPLERLSDDVAALQLEFASGTVGHLLASRVSTGLGDNIIIQVYGSDGAFIADDRRPNEILACVGEVGVARRVWATMPVAENEREPTPAQLFVQGILTGTQPSMGFDDGLWAQEVMDAAIRSAAAGARAGVRHGTANR